MPFTKEDIGTLASKTSRNALDGQVSQSRTHALIEIMGFRFCDLSLQDAATAIILDAIENNPRAVFFVNAHCVNVATTDQEYRSILRATPVLFADGAGIALAARIWGDKLRNNINGTDLLPILCHQAARDNVPIALLGSKPGVADACARELQKSHPDLKIVWHHHGYLSEEEESDVIDDLNASGAKILLVAKGVPLQEKWIHRFADRIDAPVLMGVGALLDFYSGSVPRAPQLLRQFRLEWLFRLALEPRRLFRRYVIGNPLFVFRVVHMRLRSLLRSGNFD